jgi:peptidoglycan/LPS O-acetylase OafA/YrhL
MGKIKELDGLRGILAVWVVCVHLLPSIGIDSVHLGFLSPLFGEHMRVQIFCILSGFVIFLMYDKRQPSYASFMYGRFLRLYPVYILAFLVSILMTQLALAALHGSPFSGLRMESRIANMESSLAYFPAHFLAHLTMLHGVIPESMLPAGAYAFLGQAWNISTEFQFYVVAPLLFAGLATGPLWRRLVVGAVCLLVWLALRNWPNPADLAQYAPYFAFGIFSFAVWRRDWGNRRHLNPVTLILVSAAVFVLGSLAVGIWVFIFGWLLIQRDQNRGHQVLAWLRSKPLQWLGELSYSLYLLHMIPLYLGMYLLNGLDLSRLGYLAALGLFTFGLGLPLSWACSKWIEQPSHRASSRAPKKAGLSGVPAGQGA